MPLTVAIGALAIVMLGDQGQTRELAPAAPVLDLITGAATVGACQSGGDFSNEVVFSFPSECSNLTAVEWFQGNIPLPSVNSAPEPQSRGSAYTGVEQHEIDAIVSVCAFGPERGNFKGYVIGGACAQPDARAIGEITLCGWCPNSVYALYGDAGCAEYAVANANDGAAHDEPRVCVDNPAFDDIGCDAIMESDYDEFSAVGSLPEVDPTVLAVVVSPESVSGYPTIMWWGQQFSATVYAVGGASTGVTWASSNPGVATVNSSGFALPVGIGGETGVCATSVADGTKSGCANISFTGPESISISGPTVVRSGWTCTWTASVSGGPQYNVAFWSTNAGGALGQGLTLETTGGTFTWDGSLHFSVSYGTGVFAWATHEITVNENAQSHPNCTS